MRALLVIASLLACAPVGAQEAQPLVADLSKHLVAITTGFVGTEVLLFGAVDGPGDVVVVVRGPPRPEVVRRKERVGGIWVNTGRADLAAVPAYYRVAATRPLPELAPPAVLERHRIGLEHLDLEPVLADKGAGAAEYRQALIRLKRDRGLWAAETREVSSLGNRLFRTDLHFPANVPTGTYSVEVYLLRGGEVVSAQTTPLIVSKIGLGAELYHFAHEHGAAYGIMAIALAGAAGWLAAAAFRKG
ncbi:MAG: TIGR02186 family protein [Alphaproteobacteria bacterium]|nr:TIGR02186 family protein [Alphaproteobacteria bacterium]